MDAWRVFRRPWLKKKQRRSGGLLARAVMALISHLGFVRVTRNRRLREGASFRPAAAGPGRECTNRRGDMEQQQDPVIVRHRELERIANMALRAGRIMMECGASVSVVHGGVGMIAR